jgi:nucleotide-binding universal stress UspA family protein
VLAVRPFWTTEQTPARDEETRSIRNLLLPVDGSDLSALVIPAALEFAGLFEGRVVLLRVLDAKKTADEAEERKEAEVHLQGLAREFERKGIDTLLLVEKGDPVEEILKTARFHGADLLAMTTHGRSGLSRLVTGSVTEEVLRRATAPLLVVRAEAPSKTRRRLAHAKRK